jgi:hypothetical protein
VLATLLDGTASPRAVQPAVDYSSPPLATSSADARRDELPSRAKKVRDDWLLSFEAVTRVPIDAGAQVGFETPFGLRVFGGYGWVPYIDVLTGIVVSASDRNLVTAFLDGARMSGDSARLVLGLRPFRKLGTYFDASYAHLRLAATVNVPAQTVQGFVFPGGTYAADTALDLWGIELGYQGLIAERLVLGAAAGVSGAIASHTSIVPTGSAPDDPALPLAASRVDRAFKTHFMPTLTLRLGFDAI